MTPTDQKTVFLTEEGDNYFRRHRNLTTPTENDYVLDALGQTGLQFGRFLEIGCSNGYRVDSLSKATGAKGGGIDPSMEAISTGKSLYGDDIDLRQGSADALPFEDDSFDLVIFGFCLYLTDPKDHFRIASETHRVLCDGGSVLIYDFLSPVPYVNDYHHFSGLKSHKMDFSRYFLAHPAYTLTFRQARPYEVGKAMDADNTVVTDIVQKNVGHSFIRNPYSG